MSLCCCTNETANRGWEAPAHAFQYNGDDNEIWGDGLFFMGHCTKLATTVIPKLPAVFDEKGAGDLHERRVPLVGSGGWSKAKIAGSREGLVPRGNYVERGGMRPVSLGAPLIYVSAAEGRVELEVRQR